ncbi:PAS domain-containing protein [Acidaminobacter sp. JC074]|uniref:sigma 54-interacting transcriptional regulator n=1 Tax=Acidaminobacter sp. JC074 TaxID=2530199 RepID=UPI001F10493E|nr:sigma 54-interacting transcriptional regulator [Acidaminobacter sp. JC074]MCH4888501.1 PAS domain-containing protein [Acidaminobacter sp. JC074]
MNLCNEYLRIVLSRMNDACIIIDTKGMIVSVNQRAEALLELKKEFYISKRIDEVIENTELIRVVETGSEEINVRFSYRDRHFFVDRLPVIQNGKIEGAIAIFHDMTRIVDLHKQSEEDKMYIETLDTILDTCSEQVVLIDENAKITMMSESYKRHLGVDNPEGKFVWEVIENTRLHIILETGESEIGDIQRIGGRRMIAMRIPVKKDGKVIGAIGRVMFNDISELKHLSKKSSVLEDEMQLINPEKARTGKYTFDSLIGESDKISKVKRLAGRAANTDSNVLITGESGTGKEVFVHAIHNASLRRNKPFIKINCAAIPSELLESELFGYEEGAFTGAKRGGKLGKVQMADGGTLLLDEIGDMPLDMQAKLLRVLQEKEVERIGGEGTVKVDVRIMASTNKDLYIMVQNKEFRQDLFYRLNVMNLMLPPLRERAEDIPALSKELCYSIANRLGIHVNGISDQVLSSFVAYDWPGNIRELENVIERAINLLDLDSIIRPEHLPEHMQSKRKLIVSSDKLSSISSYNLKKRVEALEKELIESCLNDVGFNKNQAAKILNISRVSLYKKIEQYNIRTN